MAFSSRGFLSLSLLPSRCAFLSPRGLSTSFPLSKSCFDNTNNSTIWLRDEVLFAERRTALTPQHAGDLISDGFEVTVEESKNRIFSLSEYEQVGCKIAPSGAWMEGQAPPHAFILGLKTLGDVPEVCKHRHIYFAHAFKNQHGWENEIRRFNKGGGKILDLEFLVDDQGKRLAAFGFFAGYAGMAVGIRHLAVKENEKYPSWSDFPTKAEMVEYVVEGLDEEAKEKLKKVVVVGALGGVGRGACQAYDEVVEKLGMPKENLSRWDIQEMTQPNSRPDLLKHTLMLNCILVNGPLEPFITPKSLSDSSRILEHIVDVSCDSTNPNNPLPIYNQETDFAEPAIRCVPSSPNTPHLDVTAISHLPSLLPRESSEHFSSCLINSLKKLKNGGQEWARAEKVFQELSEKVD